MRKSNLAVVERQERVNADARANHEWARFYTERMHLALVPIEPGTKGPKKPGWNQPGGYITDPVEAERFWRSHPQMGMGAVLGPSGIATLDIDDMDGARIALKAVGLDLDVYLAGCRLRGNPARAKPVFRVPDGVHLDRRALSWPSKEPGGKPITIFELRGGPVQDCLPPTIHPDIHQPYRWIHAPWKNGGMPTLPEEIFQLWTHWEELLAQMQASCPWLPQKDPAGPARARKGEGQAEIDWDSIRDQVLMRVPLESMLERLGIQKKGKRYICPFHAEKEPSFWTFDTQRGYQKWADAHGAAPVGKPTAKGYHVGDVLDLYQHIHKLPSRGKALAALAREEGILEKKKPGKGSGGPDRPGKIRRVEPDENTIHDDFDPRYVAPGIFALTDLGNAYRVVAHHGTKLRYCHEQGRWLLWNGQRWASDEQEAVMQIAKDVACKIYAEAGLIRDNMELQGEVAKHARGSQRGTRIREMLTLARSEPSIPVKVSDLDADPWALNCLNGTLDLRTGSLREHRREDLFSKLAPVEYLRKTDCPTWTSFLWRIMGGKADSERASRLIGFLKRAIGYSLTGITKEHCLLFCYGTGRNGKGTVIETIRALMGEYAQATNFSTFVEKKQDSVRNDLARLVGARFVSASESEKGSKLDEALVKSLTGEDPITARFLYKDYFEYIPVFKLWLAANHKPIIRGTDEGIWSRIHLIPFTEYIPPEERDKELKLKLRKELPGILRWAVDGCLEWQAGGLQPPEEVRSATADYRAEMDVLTDFLQEVCLLHPSCEVLSSELYAAYSKWSDANGTKTMSAKSLSLKLQERGLAPTRIGRRGDKGWSGLGLLTGRDLQTDQTDHFGADRSGRSRDGDDRPGGGHADRSDQSFHQKAHMEAQPTKSPNNQSDRSARQKEEDESPMDALFWGHDGFVFDRSAGLTDDEIGQQIRDPGEEG